MSGSEPIFLPPVRLELPARPHPLVEGLMTASHIVVGSPKSGKTLLLRQLVQSFELDGLAPEDILVLTPSRLAASRLRDDIGLDSKKAARLPRARSIHSFAFASHRDATPGLKLFSGSQQHALIKELITEHPNSPWRFSPETVRLDGFAQELRDLIALCLERDLDESNLRQLAEEFPGLNLEVAIDIVPIYLARLSQMQALDPSNLIATAPIESEAKVVLVDDAQDFSIAALELIRKLGETRQLILFGDPDASVMGFRSGLSEGFVHHFPSLPKHYLEPQGEFLTELARLSSKLPPQLAGPQRPRDSGKANSRAKLFLNQVAETDWLAAEIRRKKLELGINFAEIAVVARTRNQLEQLASLLSARSVPVHVVGAQLALSDQYFSRSILSLAQLAFTDPTASQIASVLSSSIIGMDSIGLRRLLRQLASHPDFESVPKDKLLVAAIDSVIEPNSHELAKLSKLTELLRRLSTLSNATAYELVSEIYRAIETKSLLIKARGIAEPALAANRDLDSALELFAAAQRFDQREGGSAKDFVLLQLQRGVPEDSLAPIGLRDAVQLTTASQLADKSFEIVFVPRLQDGIWPNLRPRTSLLNSQSITSYLEGRIASPMEPVRSELADEIRLLYKTFGTAKKHLYLSAIQTLEEQPSAFFDLIKIEPELDETRVEFDLRRLVGSYRRNLMQGDVTYASRLAALALLGVPGAHPESWQGLLQISTSEQLYHGDEPVRFSPSRLEAFEKCPLHWFINNFGGDGSGFEASIGTLLHEALELARDAGQMSQYVESNWHTLEFEAEWQSDALRRKALKMVSAISEYLQDAGSLIEAEQKFELNIGRLQISGKIDRVELDGQGGARVVDLKTGKVPTQAQVDSHRQLAVYQLAVRQLGFANTSGRIVAVGDQKLKVIEQPKLEGDREAELMALLAEVANSAGKNNFKANYSAHCTSDSNCQLLLTRAVTDA